MLFKLERRAVAQGAVAAVGVGEGFEVIEDRERCGGAGAGALSAVEGGGMASRRASALRVATKLSARALSWGWAVRLIRRVRPAAAVSVAKASAAYWTPRSL